MSVPPSRTPPNPPDIELSADIQQTADSVGRVILDDLGGVERDRSEG